jgi:hypothetical protein
VNTRQIRSNPDESNPRPWADFELGDGSLSVTVGALNGLHAFREAMAARGERPYPEAERTKVGASRRPTPTKHTLSLSTEQRPADEQPSDPARPSLADEVHVLAVTLEGDLEFVPTSRQRHVYYAHLAWYDPLTKVWDKLQFVEG